MISNKSLIHLFAILHLGVSFTCLKVGIADELMLTLLTMFMVVLLCLKRRVGFIFMTVAVIVVNIVGFFIGNDLAYLIGMIPRLPELAANPISTFACTEAIGWGTEFCILWYRKKYPEGSFHSSRGMHYMLIAFILVIILRLALILFKTDVRESDNFLIEILVDQVFSCIAILIVAEYAIRAHAQAEKAAQEASLAHFRYMKFKQQLNPHFLFNSLNVLDCLIQEGAQESASRFTHRLADIYRYMLRTEEALSVSLAEEMKFVHEYVALLQVRFPSGFEVEYDLPAFLMDRSVIPCSVQLLIENAVKHNAVSVDNPLIVSISAVKDASGADCISVSNNIRPRYTSSSDSTGLGLTYLRRQYSDMSHRQVEIISENEYYTVIIPLL